MGPDHVGPQMIVDVQVQETIPMTMFFNHQGILSSLLWKSGAVLTSTEDLVVE